MSQPQGPFALELIPEREMPESIDRAIRQLLRQCFPADQEVFATTRAWHGSVPTFSVIHRRRDAVVGHVAIVIRTVRCRSTPVTVAGVESLCVAPSHRKTGLSAALMDRALKEAAKGGIRFGLLFCLPELQRFYGPLGWFRLDRPVTMLDADGREAPIPAKNITMAIQLAEEPFPEGPIHLQGPDW